MSQTEAISIPGLREFDPNRHVSKLLHDSENSRVVLFCLEPGQELSPHQSTSEVVFYCVEGKPEIILSNERVPLPGQSIVV
ncbi:MAG: hypothetical protein HYX90_03795, partial [Chloroflexi bacterium]|nr:hypothetical protein [Chloroflexota bacterium]